LAQRAEALLVERNSASEGCFPVVLVKHGVVIGVVFCHLDVCLVGRHVTSSCGHAFGEPHHRDHLDLRMLPHPSNEPRFQQLPTQPNRTDTQYLYPTVPFNELGRRLRHHRRNRLGQVHPRLFKNVLRELVAFLRQFRYLLAERGDSGLVEIRVKIVQDVRLVLDVEVVLHLRPDHVGGKRGLLEVVQIVEAVFDRPVRYLPGCNVWKQLV
jgi:hypothetical protein